MAWCGNPGTGDELTMSLAAEISGHKDLFKLADALRDAKNRQLGAELDRGVRKAAKVLEREVRAHTDDYMPKGFEATFAGALTAKIEIRLANGRRASVMFSAK